MRIKGTEAGILFLILMIGGVSISMFTGYWATEGSKIPVKFESGEYAGLSNPADIRGSYAFADIEKAFDIPVSILAQAFVLSDKENLEAIQVKTFEQIYGIIDGKEIGTDSMRYFVALYKGLPYNPEEDTALPKPAVSILRKEGSMSEEELAEAEMRAVSMDSLHVSATGEVSEEQDSEEKIIKGKTMFTELYEWGITKEELEKIMGIPVGVRTETVRDYCMKNGIEFSTVKIPVQELLDSK